MGNNFCQCAKRHTNLRDPRIRVGKVRHRGVVDEHIAVAKGILHLEILDVGGNRKPIDAVLKVSSLQRRVIRWRERVDPVLDHREDAENRAVPLYLIVEASGTVEIGLTIPGIVIEIHGGTGRSARALRVLRELEGYDGKLTVAVAVVRFDGEEYIAVGIG